MESHTSTTSKTFIVTAIIITLANEVGAWEGNTFLQLHDHLANIMNWSKCWACSHLPRSLGSGHPVIAVVFPNSTSIMAGLSSITLQQYTSITQESLNWRVDLSLLWDETQGVPCVQRCFLKNTTNHSNSGGNNTDPRCGTPKFVGNYFNCTSYIKYGGANMWATNQTRRGKRTTPHGWPTPKGLGWYWICGHMGYKVLPLGWVGQCAMGTIIPNITVKQNLIELISSEGLLRTYMRPLKRSRRQTNPLILRPTGFHSFARWFLPWLGVSELEKALVNISAAVEVLGNTTKDAIEALQTEITSLSKMALQNRLGLDMLFAQQGGLCTVIGEHCCMYINQDKRIEKDLSLIWKQTKLFHEITKDNTAWGFSDLWEKLTSWLPNLKWLKQLFVTAVIIVFISITLCVTVRCGLWCFQSTGASYNEWKKNQLRHKLESNKYFEKILSKETAY